MYCCLRFLFDSRPSQVVQDTHELFFVYIVYGTVNNAYSVTETIRHVIVKSTIFSVSRLGCLGAQTQ